MCTNCAKANRECSYSRSARRKEPRNTYVVELERRLLQIEGILSGEGLLPEQHLDELPAAAKGGRKPARAPAGPIGEVSSAAGPSRARSESAGRGISKEGNFDSIDGGTMDDASSEAGSGDESDSAEDLQRILALKRRIEEVGQLAGLRLQQGSGDNDNAMAAHHPGQFFDSPALFHSLENHGLEDQERRDREMWEIKQLADSLFVGLVEPNEGERARSEGLLAHPGTEGPMDVPTHDGQSPVSNQQLEDLLAQLYSGTLEGNFDLTGSASVPARGADVAPVPRPANGKRRRTQSALPTTALGRDSSAGQSSLPSAHLTFETDLQEAMLFSVGVPIEPEPEPAVPGDPLANALMVRDSTTSTNRELLRIRREGRGFGVDEVGLATLEMGMFSGSDHPFQMKHGRDATDRLLADMSQLSIRNQNPSPGLLQIMSRLVPPVQFRPDLFFAYFKRSGGWSPCVFVPERIRELQEGNISPIGGWAMCASGLLYTDSNEPRKTGYNTESEIYFARAKRLVPACLDEPALTSVQALLTMTLYATGSGRPSAAWMYSGMALRMAHELRLHQRLAAPLSLSMSIVEQESRNRTWWACFLVDVSMSAIADRPGFVHVDDVTTDLPDDDLWNDLDDYGNPLPGSKGELVAERLRSEGNVHGGKVVNAFGQPLGDGSNSIQKQFHSHGFREYVTLMMLFSKVIRYVKRNKAERAASLRTVDPELAKLDSQLIDWYARLPEKLCLSSRPLVEIVRNEVDQRKFVSSSLINLVYHATYILIHRPELTLQNFAWPSGSSFDACTRAAGTITNILERLLSVDPKCEYVNAFAAFCIFESGVIHLVNSIVADLLTQEQLEAYTASAGTGVSSAGAPTRTKSMDSDRSINDSRRQKHAILEASKRGLRTHMAALGALKHYWASAECYFVTLGRLITENNILSPREIYGPERVQALPADPQEYFNLLLSEGGQAQVRRRLWRAVNNLLTLFQMSEMNALQRFAQ